MYGVNVMVVTSQDNVHCVADLVGRIVLIPMMVGHNVYRVEATVDVLRAQDKVDTMK